MLSFRFFFHYFKSPFPALVIEAIYMLRCAVLWTEWMCWLRRWQSWSRWRRSGRVAGPCSNRGLEHGYCAPLLDQSSLRKTLLVSYCTFPTTCWGCVQGPCPASETMTLPSKIFELVVLLCFFLCTLSLDPSSLFAVWQHQCKPVFILNPQHTVYTSVSNSVYLSQFLNPLAIHLHTCATNISDFGWFYSWNSRSE